MAELVVEVGAGGHGLGLEGLNLGEDVGPHLIGNDAAQVGLEIHMIHHPQAPAAVHKHLHMPAIATIVGAHQPAAGRKGKQAAVADGLLPIIPVHQPEIGIIPVSGAVTGHPGIGIARFGQARGEGRRAGALAFLSGPHTVEAPLAVMMHARAHTGLFLDVPGQRLGRGLVPEGADLNAVDGAHVTRTQKDDAHRPFIDILPWGLQRFSVHQAQSPGGFELHQSRLRRLQADTHGRFGDARWCGGRRQGGKSRQHPGSGQSESGTTLHGL